MRTPALGTLLSTLALLCCWRARSRCGLVAMIFAKSASVALYLRRIACLRHCSWSRRASRPVHPRGSFWSSLKLLGLRVSEISNDFSYHFCTLFLKDAVITVELDVFLVLCFNVLLFKTKSNIVVIFSFIEVLSNQIVVIIQVKLLFVILVSLSNRYQNHNYYQQCQEPNSFHL